MNEKRWVLLIASEVGRTESVSDRAMERLVEAIGAEGYTVTRTTSPEDGLSLVTSDPSYSAVQGAFTAAFNDYVRGELKWESDFPYEILTGKVNPWSYARQQNQYLNVSENLRQAMTQNPALHVLSMNGYYDMATPFFATEYVFSHMGLAPSLSSHVSFAYCDAGHMMYTRKTCLDSLDKAMSTLYSTALKAPPANGGRAGSSTLK